MCPSNLQPLNNGRSIARGFTAIELMVTIAILGVLAAMAAPSFATLIDSWRVRQTSDQLQSTLYFARSEAIKRGGRVVIQKLPNNTSGCTTASGTRDWDCGWIVCHDLNDNGSCVASEPVLMRTETGGISHVSRTGGGASIKLNRWGLVSGPYLGFNLVPLNKSVSHPSARGLCMSSGGRIHNIPQEEIPCTG